MRRFLKSKLFIMSALCIIIAAIGIMVSITNRVESDNTVVATNIDKTTDIISDTDKKQFYGTFMTEANWVADPSESKNLLQFTKDNATIKVKIKSIGDAMFLKNATGFSNPNPFTPVEVVVENSLDGQALPKINTVYMRGGDVKISALMETLDQETIKKMGLDTLRKEQQKKMYVSYKSEYDYNLIPGEEYVIVVAKNSNNVYTIVGNGYGIFEEYEENGVLIKDEQMTSEVKFKNVLTKKELTDRNGTVLKHKK